MRSFFPEVHQPPEEKFRQCGSHEENISLRRKVQSPKESLAEEERTGFVLLYHVT